MITELSGLKRLWINELGPEENVHSQVLFRRHFEVPEELHDAVIHIAADSDFILTLDGVELDRGQFSDDPLRKTFTAVKVPYLAAGRHLLAIRVYYIGKCFSSYAPGMPGLYIALENEKFCLQGDEKFLCRADLSFRSGACDTVSPQIGFTTSYDLRRAVDWSNPELDDSSWSNACVLEREPERLCCMRPAMIRPALGDFKRMRIIDSGSCGKMKMSELPTGAAGRMAHLQRFSDKKSAEELAMPFRLQNPARYAPVSSGVFLLADLGYEETGFIELDLQAPAGTVIHYSHGEHIDDGHVRSEIYGRNFADTVIWQGGRGHFMLDFRRAGLRYLELYVENPDDDGIVVYALGVRPWRLPLADGEFFSCSSDELNTLCRNAVHTLELCMHDHYEDCPWREQSLYSYDSRLQMIYGYYLWGNYDFAAASLELFVPGQQSSGHFNLCAPSRSRRTIPVYTFVWLEALYENCFYRGAFELAQRCKSAADAVKELIISRLDPVSGLLKEDEGDAYWHFYEWCSELNGRNINGTGNRFSALYNAYGLLALEAYDKLFPTTEIKDFTEKLRENIRQAFYLPQEKYFASFLADGKLSTMIHEHTQALMLLAGVVPENDKAMVYERWQENRFDEPSTLSSLYFVLDALAENKENIPYLYGRIINYYRPMLANNSTTLWETQKGSCDFGYAGSLCHGWSALPIYFAQTAILGVKYLEPGGRKIMIEPVCCGLAFARGKVQTAAGEVKISWSGNGEIIENIRVELPANISVEVNSDAQVEYIRL